MRLITTSFGANEGIEAREVQSLSEFMQLLDELDSHCMMNDKPSRLIGSLESLTDTKCVSEPKESLPRLQT